MDRTQDPKIIVALDFANIEQVRNLVSKLDPRLCRLKVATTLFTRYGPALVEELIRAGFAIFLDLKFHDIPQQVAGAVRAAAELGVWMIDLHLQGGVRMVQAARREIDRFPAAERPLLTGVTILTSLEQDDLLPMGISEKIDILVTRMARLAEHTGLDGIVCSPHEVAQLRQYLPRKFLLVTPGIRIQQDAHEDQRRVMTPRAAMRAGADYLVIGRSITQAPDPVAILRRVESEISS